MQDYDKYITQYGLDKLMLSLEELQSQRPQFLEDVVNARSIPGDDNSDLTLAVSAIEALDLKIKELTDIVELSEVYTCKYGDSVEFGDIVTLLSEDKEEVSYKIVGTNEIGFCANSSCMSVMSPIAQAVLGHGVGDEVDIQLPSGYLVYTIVGMEK